MCCCHCCCKITRDKLYISIDNSKIEKFKENLIIQTNKYKCDYKIIDQQECEYNKDATEFTIELYNYIYDIMDIFEDCKYF
jgi:hypothetical protein